MMFPGYADYGYMTWMMVASMVTWIALIVLCLGDVHRAEAAGLDLLVRGPEPGRDRVAADDGRGKDRQRRGRHVVATRRA